MQIDLIAIGLAGALLLSAGCDSETTTPAPEPPAGPDPVEAAEVDPEPVEQDSDDEALVLDEDTRAALEAMGYVESAPTDNPEDVGVTEAASGASTGVRLYSTRHRASAALIDRSGEVLHEWEVPEDEHAPNRWMHVEPLAGGDLLAVAMGHSLTRHRWDSSVVWRASVPAHHDVAVGPDETLYALVRWAERIDHDGTAVPVLVDGVQLVSADGQVGRRVELLPLMQEHVQEWRLDRLKERVEAGEGASLARGGGPGDLMHTNSIEPLHTAVEGVGPAGAWLLSFRNLNRIAVLDAELTRVLWVWGSGELQGQHDATQLENGHLLIFDNGTRRGVSRVIELDATTGEIVWSYEREGVFTLLRGGAQRLPSGNTLITESDRGHAFEVTPDGETVWEFWNPDLRRTESGQERGVIYRMNRFDASSFPALAQGQTAATPSTDEE